MKCAFAVVDEQDRPGARQQDQVLIAVVVDVGEERLRRAIEDGDTGRFGDVLERAVSGVPEQAVGQTVGLRHVEVVEAVAVDVADRHAMMAHAAGSEDRVEMRRPVVEAGHELADERRVTPQRDAR